MCRFELRDDAGASQFTEANRCSTLKQTGNKGCLCYPPASFPTSSTPHFLSSCYMPGIIFWGLRGKCYAVSILVGKTMSSKRQEREKHIRDDKTKSRLGEMSGIMSITQDGQGHRRARFSLLDFLEVAGMICYCWWIEFVQHS